MTGLGMTAANAERVVPVALERAGGFVAVEPVGCPAVGRATVPTAMYSAELGGSRGMMSELPGPAVLAAVPVTVWVPGMSAAIFSQSYFLTSLSCFLTGSLCCLGARVGGPARDVVLCVV